MVGPVFLFTGQGSQFVGMGQELAGINAAAQQVFQTADNALGEDLTGLITAGPEADLALTENTQPAVLAADIAVFQALGCKPALAAGHSLGEYAALVAAGALDLAAAIKLVRVRAKAMQAAVPVGTGGMVVLRKAGLEEARELAGAATKGKLELANINCPGQYVLSGEIAAIEEVIEKVGARRALKLPVSVPFHSSLLSEAAKGFAAELAKVEFRDPQFPIVCNVDAGPVSTAAAVVDALARQFDSPVRWEPSLQYLLEMGHRTFVECGPKPTLIRMVQAVARKLGVDGVEVMAPVTPDEIVAAKETLGG